MQQFKDILKNTFGIIMMISCVWLAKIIVWDYPESKKSLVDFLCETPWSFVLVMVIIFGIFGNIRNED
jgi:hypothetical protein